MESWKEKDMGCTLHGQITSSGDPRIKAVLTVIQSTVHTPPRLGKFKEATFYMNGEVAENENTFTIQGHAYGHHVISLTGTGHRIEPEDIPSR